MESLRHLGGEERRGAIAAAEIVLRLGLPSIPATGFSSALSVTNAVETEDLLERLPMI